MRMPSVYKRYVISRFIRASNCMAISALRADETSQK